MAVVCLGGSDSVWADSEEMDLAVAVGNRGAKLLWIDLKQTDGRWTSIFLPHEDSPIDPLVTVVERAV
jgi:hypothetical protein